MLVSWQRSVSCDGGELALELVGHKGKDKECEGQKWLEDANGVVVLVARDAATLWAKRRLWGRRDN